MTDFNEKQIQILQVAEKLFAANGFDGTSIRDISKEANVNVAMVSYYFGSKEKLLEEIILFRTTDLKLQLENLFKESLSPIEKIDKLIELYISRVNNNKCIYQIMNFELSNNKRVIDFKAFMESKKNNLEILKKIIEEGQSLGLFKKDIVIPLITPTLLGPYFHFQMNKPFFIELLGLNTEAAYEKYITTHLTKHIQQTIKSLLII